MTVHDWSRADSGLFHDFHQAWTVELCHALNGGVLPSGCWALLEPSTSEPIHERIVRSVHRRKRELSIEGGIRTLAEDQPSTRLSTAAVLELYACKGNRLVIRHSLGHVVAVLEVVSPGNKSSRHALRQFVEKAYDLLRQGIHLLVIDLFPPSSRDPQGIHKAIWDEIEDQPFALPEGKPLTVAAYWAGDPKTAYVEPVAVGDKLPDGPLFLDLGTYVNAPLEQTYQATWDKCPIEVKELVEPSAAEGDKR